MLVGILALLAFPGLPAPSAILPVSLFLTILLSLHRHSRILLFAVFGFVWAWWSAQHLLAMRLTPDLEGRDLPVCGWIASIPQPETEYLRFRFQVESLAERTPSEGIPQQIRLTWSGNWHRLVPGQHWCFTVRLKRPRGYMNPGSFDYEGWLFREGVGATGYVRHGHARLLDDAPRYPLLRARTAVSGAIKKAIPKSRFAGVAAALAVGDTTGITSSQWQVFRNTGTAHLMAISGLHIGLLATLIFLLIRLIWRRSAWLCERIPTPQAAAVAALLGASAYAAMAGFSVPTQRALIMLAVATGAILLRRYRRWQDVIGLALIIILLFDPLSVCSIGFWLSFGAVASILYAMSGRIRMKRGWWRELLRTQWAVGIGLLPILLFSFHRSALLSPLANLIAVPVYSLLVVPLTLSGTVLLPAWHWGGALLLNGAAHTMALSWPLLDWLANLPHSQLTAPAVTPISLLIALIGAAWLLAPRGLPGRWLGVVLFLPLFVPGNKPILPGNFDLSLLDVGQGLSAVIRTAHHVLLYDTGPAFAKDSDTVKLVVLPWMQARGVGGPDLAVISHEDNDHAGGLPRLRARFPELPILSGAVGRFSNVWLCVSGQHWRWDGVSFDVLYPDKSAPKHGNNASCVLKVSSAAGSALLVGDLMRKGERRLLRDHPAEIHAQVLIAPHHGSNSSSSPPFVNAVSPGLVMFPVGYRNRWQFPRPSVVARYQAAGASIADTVHDGAIDVSFRAGQLPAVTERWRKDEARLWTAH